MKLKATEIAKDEYRRFDPVKPSSSELAFVLHVLASLAPKGRAAVLVPNGILFRGGDDAVVRQHLIETGRIAAIIALPPHLIPGTPISVSVLVLRSEATATQQKTCLFIDLSAHAEGPTTRRHLSARGIEEAAQCVQQQSSKQGFSAIIPQEDVVANEFNLSVGRYVQLVALHDFLPLEQELKFFASSIEKRNAAEAEALRLVRLVKPTKDQTRRTRRRDIET